MKKAWYTLCSLLLASFCLSNANAQSAVQVGRCFDAVAQRAFDLDSNLWMRDVQNHGNQFRAQRDPSGMTFLLLPSAHPAFRYWVTWDRRVIRIAPDGSWVQSGHCEILDAFVAQMRPAPIVPPDLDFYSTALETQSVTDTQAPEVKLPERIAARLPKGDEFLPQMQVRPDRLAACRASSNGDTDRFFDCVANTSMGEKEREAYNCARSAGSNKEALSMCMLKATMGQQERELLGRVEECARQYGSNWNQYPVCMAADQFDAKTQRAVSCVQQNIRNGSANYWGMAACYAGPDLLDQLQPNAESMVAIECAMGSGGEPTTFVGCTSGRLMASELQKCLTLGVGGNGCFGDGNTITQTYKRIGEEIEKTFGKKSVVADAWKVYAATTNPADAAKALNNVVREGGKAGENIAREAQKVLPRIKIKRIKIKW